jgi:hypothetical protein
LYQFIEVLLQFQSEINAKIKGAAKIKEVSRQTRLKQEFVSRQIVQYETGQITRKKFLFYYNGP